MKLERIELADCGTPESLVVGILKQVPDLPIPVPIDIIASQLDITEIRDVDTEGFEGGLIAFENKHSGKILVNEQSNPQRRRFTIGHELGHFLSPWHKPSSSEGFRCTTQDMRRESSTANDQTTRMEVEANRFAAGLLLPIPYFRKDLLRLKLLDVQNIVDLAKRYDVSKEATARRYVEENDEPCGVVISRNGTILRSYRHKSFPFIDVHSRNPVPNKTITATANIAEGKASDWCEVDGGVWLGTQRGSRSPHVYEQVLIQQSGFRLTLLSLDDEGSTDTDDDDREVESRWSVKFHRR